MNSAQDTRCRVGCPIRRSRDQRSLASPPGFSQRATSFIASQCQGIHQMPFNRARSQDARPAGSPGGFTRNATRPGKPPRTGASPTVLRTARQPRRGRSHEDTFLDGAPHAGSRLRPRPVRLGHIHKSTSPFNQHRLRGPARTSQEEPRSAAAAPNFASPNRRTSQPKPGGSNPVPPMVEVPMVEAPMVEVNGIEPMTSCLQSRRSPN